MMHRFLPMSWRSPLTVPMMTVPTGSIPDAERMGSMWAMPAFIARADISTSGTKMMLVPELDPDYGHSGDEAVVHDRAGGEAIVERLPGQPVDLVVVAHDQRVGDIVHLGIRVLVQGPDVFDLEGSRDVLKLLQNSFVC